MAQPQPSQQQRSRLSRLHAGSSRALVAATALLLLLSILLLSPSAAVAAAAAAAARSPLVATWVTLSPVAASPWDGLPAGRCDHTFASLTGLSFRRNVAFPGVNEGARPAQEDPFLNQFWLSGGHGAKGLTDSWLLDIGRSPPRWHKLNYSSSSVDIGSRWSNPVGFVPKSLGPAGELGLNAVMFGGANGNPAPHGYDGDVPVFNFANRSWSKWAQTPAQVTDSVPYPRGWTSWVQLPEGFGTGHIAPDAPDSGSFYMLGGMGDRDGFDLSEEWIYDLPNNRWTRLDAQVCLQNITTCGDQTTLAALLTQYANDSGTFVGLDASLRPAAVISQYSALLAAMLTENSTVAALANDDASCTQSCARFQTNSSTIARPPPLEGTRMGIIGTKMYSFGGYSCTFGGVSSTGGDECFVDSMWIMDMSNLTWTEVSRGAASASSAANWPSRRAYNVLVAHEDSGLILVQGGWYLDLTGVAIFYNDVFAFDVVSREFIPVKVQGRPPQLAWSANAAVLDDDVYLSGGCLNSQYWDQIVVLKLGLAVQAANCYASGAGLASAVAGVSTGFTIQTREFVYNETGLAPSRSGGGGLNNGTVVFGANATYGTGLSASLSVSLVTSTAQQGQGVVLVTASVTELGLGLYGVSYLAEVGRAYQVFVSLDNVQVPGSPFALTLHPNPLLIGPGFTTVSGLGSELVEKGGVGTLLLSMADIHGNGFDGQGFLLSNSDRETSDDFFPSIGGAVAFTTATNTSFVVSASLGLNAGSLGALQFDLRNLHNGSMLLSYHVPSNYEGFVLALEVDGVPVVGSPFAVQALTPLTIPHSLVVALWFLSFLVISLCAVCSALVYWLRREAVMRSSSPRFLQLLLLGSSMSSLTVVFLADEGRDSSCQASHTVLTTGLVLAMAALLAKSHRVMRIFTAKQLKVQSNLSDAHLAVPVAVVTLTMLLLNLLWIGIDPQRSEYRPSANYPQVLQYRLCTSDDLIAWVAIMLSFCGAGLLYGVKIAVGVSQLPEQFNESKMIASSLYNTCICCMFTIPLMFFLGSSSDFVVGRLILQSLVILWISSFNAAALIGPKLLLLARLRWNRLPSNKTAAGASGGQHSSAGANKATTTGSGAAAAAAKQAARAAAIQMDPMPRGIGGGVGGRETEQLNGGSSDSAAETFPGQSAARAPPGGSSSTGGGKRAGVRPSGGGFDDVLTINPAVAGGVAGGRPTHAGSSAGGSVSSRPIRNLPPLPPVRGSASVAPAPAPAAAPAAAAAVAAVSSPSAVSSASVPESSSASASPVVFPAIPPPPPVDEEDDGDALPEPEV